MLVCRRPARQRGTSGGVWSWGGIARGGFGLKRLRAEPGGGSEQRAARRGASRVDAALSPGRHSPGELRVPRLPGSGTFQGVPPALAEASSVPSSRRVGPRGDALKAPMRGPKREARDQGAAERGVFRDRVRQAPGPWPLGPGPAIRGFTHRRWTPAAPGLRARVADPAPRTRPGAPRARPSLVFRGSRTSRPSCLGPGQGREKEDA